MNFDDIEKLEKLKVIYDEKNHIEGVETFEASFTCKNCRHYFDLKFPVNTRISRAPFLMYEDAETNVVIPGKKYGTHHEVIRCPKCKIGKVK